MSSVVLLSTIVISLVVGFVLADWLGAQILKRRWQHFLVKFCKRPSRIKDSRYADVLTHLLDQQSDEALDHFISNMAVSADTLEMHLALGTFLQKRGEFDRAIRVHQNLLAHPDIPSQSTHQVRLELANDYWKSGLLDRAEDLLSDLMITTDVSQTVRRQAAASLIELYQDLGEWTRAIDVADQLTEGQFAPEPDHWRQLQAQYCCEIAAAAFEVQEHDAVDNKIRKALSYDPRCVRAYFLRADLELKNKDFTSALRALDRVVGFDASYMSEVIPRYYRCLDERSLSEKLSVYQRHAPSLTALLAIVTLSSFKKTPEHVFHIMAEELARIPTLDNEVPLLQLAINARSDGQAKLEIIIEYLKAKQAYRCAQCGVQHEKLVWLCPSCKKWGTVKLKP